MICNISLQYYLHNCTIQVLNCSWQRRLSELVSRDRVRFLHSGHLFCKWHCYHLKNVVAFHQNCFTDTVVLLGVCNKPSKMRRISDNRTPQKKTKQAHREILTTWGHERNLSSWHSKNVTEVTFVTSALKVYFRQNLQQRITCHFTSRDDLIFFRDWFSRMWLRSPLLTDQISVTVWIF